VVNLSVATAVQPTHKAPVAETSAYLKRYSNNVRSVGGRKKNVMKRIRKVLEFPVTMAERTVLVPEPEQPEHIYFNIPVDGSLAATYRPIY